MRVLVVKMSSLGDVVHTLPALTDAAARLPGVRFDWVVEEAFAEIPGWHPAVDRVIPVALRRWRRRPLRDFRGPEWRRARAELGHKRYDAVIDAQGLIKSAFVARLARGPRYGMDRRSAREGLASAAYHHRIPVPRDMHAVERSRKLFARALGYADPDQAGDYGLSGVFEAGSPPAAPTLLFFHGTARAEKLWPEEHWRDLVRRAAAGEFRVWLPWGNPREKERAGRIAAAHQCAEVLPALGLAGVARKLLQARAAVAVDTGLGHLAAALGVPGLSLYGPTSTALVGTYGANQVHVRSPAVGSTRDAAALMRAIGPAMVWDALRAQPWGRR